MKRCVLNTEEKVLVIVPVIGMYIDMIFTIFLSQQVSQVLLYELNTLFKNWLLVGEVGLFFFLISASFALFISWSFLIHIMKFFGFNIKYMYALVFIYFGIRINGAWSWI
jgi:hypothetical protein